VELTQIQKKKLRYSPGVGGWDNAEELTLGYYMIGLLLLLDSGN